MPGYSLEVAESAEAEAPAEFDHLLVWYTDLRNRALRGYMSEPVSLESIEAYGRKLARVGVDMDPLDEELLARLDGIWLDSLPKTPSTGRPPP